MLQQNLQIISRRYLFKSSKMSSSESEISLLASNYKKGASSPRKWLESIPLEKCHALNSTFLNSPVNLDIKMRAKNEDEEEQEEEEREQEQEEREDLMRIYVPSNVLIDRTINLQDPRSYTGHCFRRSSTTLLADAGGDLMTYYLKAPRRWKVFDRDRRIRQAENDLTIQFIGTRLLLEDIVWFLLGARSTQFNVPFSIKVALSENTIFRTSDKIESQLEKANSLIRDNYLFNFTLLVFQHEIGVSHLQNFIVLLIFNVAGTCSDEHNCNMLNTWSCALLPLWNSFCASFSTDIDEVAYGVVRYFRGA
ncbi:hypothetical protein NQ317_002335 [Molorchus minor]|uniref:Uncharacterized protein n=1 Tax=Molorchus minor TaxID=1323400 RepID=A0ABQ9JVL7_9CUCU|nr:hypothetical protein NQ317_002335 [Molorchus minor]